MGDAREQHAEAAARCRTIEDFGAGGAFRGDHEEPPSVLARPGVVVTQRMGVVPVNEAVGLLFGAQLVIIYFLELILGGEYTLLRRVVGAVIEPFGVGGPDRARELHPVDSVLREFARAGVHHADLHPVRAGSGGGIGQVAAVLREREVGKGHRAVVGKAVGIEEHLALGGGIARAVEHRLVLEPVVIEIVVIIPVSAQAPLFGIVPQLGQPLADRVAVGYLPQVVLRDGVLGLDPCGRGLRIVVLQPAVGVGDLGAEVVVHHLAARGFGVGKAFDFHLVAFAACRQGGGAQRKEGRQADSIHTVKGF